MMIRAILHPEAMRERAAELEAIARRLRAAAAGNWPEAAEASLLEGWSVGTRTVDVVVGTRMASGRHHRSSPLLVLDEDSRRAMSLHQTYRLGTPKDPHDPHTPTPTHALTAPGHPGGCECTIAEGGHTDVR